ncbi:MAG: TIGR03086 family metal-binding protein [Dehalococcoidia bacterium]
MTQQTMPNPVELYQAAVAQTRKFVAGVQREQMSASTPCAEWNVQQLLDHVTQTSGILVSALAGGKPAAASNLSALEAYDAATSAAVQAAKTPGALEKTVKGPMGEMPGGRLVGIIFSDNLIHGWDLAKATGQDTTLDPKLVDICCSMLEPVIEGARSMGAFGPEVQTPADASAQAKFLGMTGRKA